MAHPNFDAIWRTTVAGPKRVEISFSRPSGEIVRLDLADACVKALAETLNDYVFRAGFPPRFSEFATLWPWWENESREQAEGAWNLLSLGDLERAIAGVQAYLAFHEAARRRRCLAKTYLSDRLFEDIALKGAV